MVNLASRAVCPKLDIFQQVHDGIYTQYLTVIFSNALDFCEKYTVLKTLVMFSFCPRAS